MYCRGCQALRPHDVDPGDSRYVLCGACKRPVHGAEVVCVFASDVLFGRGEILPPLALLAPLVYAAKVWRREDEAVDA